MAKKKTKKEQSVNTSMSYSGQVTVERVCGNKVVKKTTIKNTGCKSLFSFFANCLTLSEKDAEELGVFNSQPQYLNCFNVPANAGSALTFVDKAAIKSYIRQTGVSIESSSDAESLANQTAAYATVKIRFLLQDNNFKDSDTPINALALYSGNNVANYDKPMAYIVIDKAIDYIRYIEGSNYIITWNLRLANLA